jgi:nitronate monooxygenase
MLLDRRPTPIVLAPLAGGPSTPQLAAAVSAAGGLGFLGSGYLSAARLAEDIREARQLTTEPLGVNLFVPGAPSDPAVVTGYAATLRAEAAPAGVELGEPRHSDDDWQAKLDLLTAEPVEVVSFTFGCPPPAVVGRLHDVGTEVWVTVTSADDADLAMAAGADALVAQGAEAGGHRGGTRDDDEPLGLLALLQLLSGHTDLPLVATGGIATGAGIAAALAAGARAAALGSAFLRCPEAGTAPVYRETLRSGAPTALTRAFTGRLARGLRNRFLDEHSAAAPSAYPEVHYLTAPLRQAGRATGDADVVNLWAGQAYRLGRDLPAAELVRSLHAEARAAAARAGSLLGAADLRRAYGPDESR